MRNILLLAIMLTGMAATAQNARWDNNPIQVPNRFATDIVIENDTNYNQRDACVAVAYNGWIYAAYTTVNPTTNSGGITIRKSTDNGFNWTTFDFYSSPNIRFSALNIILAGTDTNNLKLFVAAVNYNVNTGNSFIFIDSYNATTTAFISTEYQKSTLSRTVYDLSLATDFLYPAVGASPYSVALLYTVEGASIDSVIFVCSIDGGNSFPLRRVISATDDYYGKASIAYGRCATSSNGIYYAAWERLVSPSSITGNIFTSHNISLISDNFTSPVRLDTGTFWLVGRCGDPVVSVQYNNIDNDSNSATEVILVKRDYAGDGQDVDVMGFYNKKGPTGNYWKQFRIADTYRNDYQADIIYNPGNDRFLVTHYQFDIMLAEKNRLLYYDMGMNMTGVSLTTTNPWDSIRYNDQQNDSLAWPKVAANPVANMGALVWNSEGPNNKGIALFDAEYALTSINEGNIISMDDINLYPNPSSNYITLNYSGNNSSEIMVFNSLGALVTQRTASDPHGGTITETFDVSTWPEGIYVFTVTDDNRAGSIRAMIIH